MKLIRFAPKRSVSMLSVSSASDRFDWRSVYAAESAETSVSGIEAAPKSLRKSPKWLYLGDAEGTHCLRPVSAQSRGGNAPPGRRTGCHWPEGCQASGSAPQESRPGDYQGRPD